MNKKNLEKVFFVQKNDEGAFETESLWCIKSKDYFVIDNIPFIAKRVSLGDTIQAEYDDEDGVFYFDDFVEISGNTTIRLFYSNKLDINTIRNELSKLGCDSEVLQQKAIIAVNVPKEVNYQPIKLYLDNGEQSGFWVYEESCLVHSVE